MKKILEWTIRHTFRPALSAKTPLSLQRHCTDLANLITLNPRGQSIEKHRLQHISYTIIEPKKFLTGYSVLYLHGGGFVVGSATSHAKLAGHIGQALKAKVYLPEYRLAPEHPQPAALEDIIEIYRHLLSCGQDPNKLIIAGDSAGGGLTISTAIALRDAGLPLPKALIVLSPWVDLSLSSSSVNTHVSRDAMLSPDWLAWCAKQYAGHELLHSPKCSPLYANLENLPPTLIHVGSEEILLDDSKRLFNALTQAGVQTEFEIFDAVGHVFQFHAGLLKESNRSLELMKNFANKWF